MAIHHHEPQQTHSSSSSSFSIEDSLYCKEEQELQQWDDDYEELHQEPEITTNYKSTPPTIDLFWEEEELLSLLSKEQETERLICFQETEHFQQMICLARTEAVDWILKVKAHFGFSSLTAILAINYVDRFISTLHFQNNDDDKPWMIQLVAVTCLSLAAKVEETYVPLLLDLQVEDTKHVFEAKTIQRMEMIVMSALQWRMNPVTPLSFLDHITRRLGLGGLTKTNNNNSNLHWEFLKQCELLLLSAVADWRFVGCLPSVLAAAAMMHVKKQVEPSDYVVVEYENQLMGVLKISKEKVDECYKLIGELSKSKIDLNGQMKQQQHQKRKHEEIAGPVGVSLDSTYHSIKGPCASVGPFVFKKIRLQDYHYFYHFPSPTISFSL
ncbi:hypothetical protein LguiA_008638 [Lonicera macranthoides]